MDDDAYILVLAPINPVLDGVGQGLVTSFVVASDDPFEALIAALDDLTAVD
jgi:hypothetical protein